MEPGIVDDPLVTVEALRDMAAAYAGSDPRNSLASPLHADLRGLPPLLMFAGTREILLDDARRFATKAQNENVDVVLNVEDGLVHLWPLFPMPEADDLLLRAAAFIEKNLSKQ